MVSFCQNSTEKTNITSYRSNVNNVLLWINSNSAAGTVSNQTVVRSSNNDDHVYWYYDCRGDVRGTFCQFCLTTAVTDIARRCPNGVSAMIWYDICVVGYSNQTFIGKVILTPSWNLTGSKNVTDSTELGKAVNYMRNLIGKVTTETNQNWAMGAFNLSDTEKRYGWVQCSRDIGKDGCKKCLETMLDKVPQCCGTKVKWAVVCPSCGMEIDDNKFYQLQTGSTSPNRGNINC
ncbi:unnamed protein product [Trifolium pratense]|uniref:Uncharacterized protein n=1 Tax=Trifolium pratense TaxID=57577 RepID=A0ACB0KPG6_TRIPR|nr:unnamed protein product [Trifolium pratense]